MLLCGSLAIISILFDNKTGILNALSFLLQTFIAYTWYKEAKEKDDKREDKKEPAPPKKFTIR
jgi:hypothetical protein